MPTKSANFPRLPLRLLGVAALAAVLALGGCKTNEDPSKAGLTDGIANLATGKYKDRQRKLKGDLKGAKDSRQHWRQQAAAMKAENERLAVEERRLGSQLAAAQSDLNRSRARLRRARRAGASRVKVARIDSDIQALQRRLARVKRSKLPVKRKAVLLSTINAEHQQLRRQTRDFTDLN
jgi:DNA repair exonuclease SbcCD ATPase subunit